MLEFVSEKAADWLIAKGAAKQEDRDVYVYGLELSFSTLFAIFLILMLALIFSHILYGVVYLLFMFPIRLFCGGYHAKTYLNCNLCTNFLFLTALAIALLTPVWLYLPLTLTIVLISGLYVYRNAPIENENHPLTEKKVQKNRRIARILIVTQCSLIVLGSFLFPQIASYVYIAGLATGVVAILMLVAKLQKQRKEVKA